MKKFALCVLVLFCWNSFTLFAQNIPQKSTIPGQALTLQTQESVNSATQNAPDDMRHCGTDEFMQQLLQDPAAKAVFLNQKAQAELKAAQKGVVPCTNPLIIPIAVHYGTPVTDANPQCTLMCLLRS